MNTMTDTILDQHKRIAFEEGVRYALEELRSVCGKSVEETDIWSEFMEGGRA